MAQLVVVVFDNQRVRFRFLQMALFLWKPPPHLTHQNNWDPPPIEIWASFTCLTRFSASDETLINWWIELRHRFDWVLGVLHELRQMQVTTVKTNQLPPSPPPLPVKMTKCVWGGGDLVRFNGNYVGSALFVFSGELPSHHTHTHTYPASLNYLVIW